MPTPDPVGAYLEPHSYTRYVNPPREVPFWIVVCHTGHHVALNSGHHYTEQDRHHAEKLAAEHNTAEHPDLNH